MLQAATGRRCRSLEKRTVRKRCCRCCPAPPFAVAMLAPRHTWRNEVANFSLCHPPPNPHQISRRSSFSLFLHQQANVSSPSTREPTTELHTPLSSRIQSCYNESVISKAAISRKLNTPLFTVRDAFEGPPRRFATTRQRFSVLSEFKVDQLINFVITNWRIKTYTWLDLIAARLTASSRVEKLDSRLDSRTRQGLAKTAKIKQQQQQRWSSSSSSDGQAAAAVALSSKAALVQRSSLD